MKIKHLLEYTFPTIQKVEVPKKRHPGRAAGRGADVQHVGGGSFADAWANPQKSPHDIRKLANFPRSRRHIDGFYFYMIELENNSDNTNPYFPRFRDIKIYTDSHSDSGGGDETKDRITYSAKMERLVDMRELNKSEQEAILRRLFGEHADKVIAVLSKSDHPYGQQLLTVIKSAVKNESNNSINDLLVDEDFKRATAFIKQVARKHSLGYDLHDENIMVRRGPTGAHLVITDPLSDQKSKDPNDDIPF